jgi:glycerol kinase
MVAACGRTLGGGGAMTRALLVGIDAGTTAVKAALLDERLEPLAEARRRLTTHHPHPGWVEQDIAEQLEAVVSAVAEVMDRADGQIVACGLDHQGESVVAWDAESGLALSPVVVWQCKRSETVLERLREQGLEDEIKQRSGLPLDPYFSAGKLTWLLENVEAVQSARDAGTLRLGTLDSFLTDRLGDVFATDVSSASRTQLQALGEVGWDPWLCERFGVPIDTLPPVRESAGRLGTLRDERWPVELPLTARVVDQQAALAGTGCVERGSVKATYGTGVFMFAHVGDEPPRDSGGLLPTVAWNIAGVTEYALDGGVFAAGSLLEWLSERVGLAPTAADVAALAHETEDAGGVRVLPAIAGLGAPWWKPQARGVISGLTGASGRAEIARAAIEGICWRVADVVEAVRDQVAVETVRVDGGLTNDRLLLELQADAIGVPIERMAADATATGSALLAAVGAGVLELASAPSLLPPAERVEPRRDERWRRENHERWREFVAATADL